MNIDARDHGDDVARQVPVGRIGRDDDMAGAAIFLASRAGDCVVGATLTVDGGVAFGRAGIDGTRWQAECRCGARPQCNVTTRWRIGARRCG